MLVLSSAPAVVVENIRLRLFYNSGSTRSIIADAANRFGLPSGQLADRVVKTKKNKDSCNTRSARSVRSDHYDAIRYTFDTG